MNNTEEIKRLKLIVFEGAEDWAYWAFLSPYGWVRCDHKPYKGDAYWKIRKGCTFDIGQVPRASKAVTKLHWSDTLMELDDETLDIMRRDDE